MAMNPETTCEHGPERMCLSCMSKEAAELFRQYTTPSRDDDSEDMIVAYLPDDNGRDYICLIDDRSLEQYNI